MDSFKNISIILVEPQNPGNIGSVARAMKNTGFPNLVLIAPVDFKTNEAFSMACKADDILQNARTYPILKDAIKDVEGMYSHIEKTLKRLGYGEKGGEYLLKAIMRTLRRLFGRTGLMGKEVNMIRGICTQIEKAVYEEKNKYPPL